MTRIQVILFDDSIDELAKMMISYVLNMPTDMPGYQKKVEVVTEFLEEVLDPSFDSVAVYLRVLMLMPATVKRKIPFRIEEFINMYERQIDEKLEDIGGIPKLYKPKRIITAPKEIILANGSTIKIADEPLPEEDKLKGLNTDGVIIQ